MALDGRHLRHVPGLRFVRLLGTGRGGDLTLSADPLRWARFAVWQDRAAFEQFEHSLFHRREFPLLAESYTVIMRPVQWHGAWDGALPFGAGTPGGVPAPSAPVAVLTRATLRPSKLRAFWQAVPASQRALHAQPGLLAALGVGEAPLLRQATFSLWRDAASMRRFAYADGEHRTVIARTRRERWYREELFARFEVLASRGSWNGRDPLQAMTGEGRDV